MLLQLRDLTQEANTHIFVIDVVYAPDTGQSSKPTHSICDALLSSHWWFPVCCIFQVPRNSSMPGPHLSALMKPCLGHLKKAEIASLFKHGVLLRLKLTRFTVFTELVFSLSHHSLLSTPHNAYFYFWQLLCYLPTYPLLWLAQCLEKRMGFGKDKS